MNMIAIAFCRSEPTVTQVAGGYYLVTYQQDTALTEMIAEETWKKCEQSKNHVEQFAEKTFDLEWKLPENDDLQVIEFLGVPTRYVKSRYRMMKAIILAKGKPVSYEEISQAGWGAVIDKDVLEDGIRNLNVFLSKRGIPKFVHCEKGFVYMDANYPSRNPNAYRKEH